MAEFVYVIAQQKRMCAAISWCDECPLNDKAGCKWARMTDGDMDVALVEEIERIVMVWAAANPEPRYPSWEEAWKQLFPDTPLRVPCPKHFMSRDKGEKLCSKFDECTDCIKGPICGEVAEKMGVKLLEATK